MLNEEVATNVSLDLLPLYLERRARAHGGVVMTTHLHERDESNAIRDKKGTTLNYKHISCHTTSKCEIF